MEIKKINIAPTWQTAFGIYISLIDGGKCISDKKSAWESFKVEALRLAKEVDRLQANQKENA